MKEETLPRAAVKFIIRHRKTGIEIEMSVLGICEEYSSVEFSSTDEEYQGIGRLPSWPGDDTAAEYDVFVVINGVLHVYDGEIYKPY